MDFGEFIDTHGVKALSIVFGVPASTVYGWSRHRRIPRRNWDRLLEAFPKYGWRDLVEMERRKQPSVSGA